MEKEITQSEFKRRMKPIMALYDARYFPLALAALPQSLTIGRWLLLSYEHENNWLAYSIGVVFAIFGAAAFEAIYVGAITWSDNDDQRGNKGHGMWFWATALSALFFSVLVAYRFYSIQEEGWAFLHSGFAIVAFCYTMQIHYAIKSQVKQTEQPQEDKDFITQALQALENRITQANTDAERRITQHNIEAQTAFQGFTQQTQSFVNQKLADFGRSVNTQIEELAKSIELVNNTKAVEQPKELTQGITLRDTVEAWVKTGKLPPAQAFKDYGEELGISRDTFYNWSRQSAKKGQVE